jgi:16S rRNA C967 or C1407 C5-methylase (RsmB/RsmF family)
MTSLGSSDEGIVIANDADTDRYTPFLPFGPLTWSRSAYMLVHQCRRLNSPLLMVTTHKVCLIPHLSLSLLFPHELQGQEFPTVLADFSPSTPTATPIRSSRASGVFDRVLCDVPCSGDGTLRKTPNIWAKWGISSAASLYPLQLQIAERGLRLVKYGGILVYSTCSLSPYGLSSHSPLSDLCL